MVFLLIIVVLEPDFDGDLPEEVGSRFGVTEGLLLIIGQVILAEDLDGVDIFLPVMVCEALEVLAIGEKLGAGFASRSRILFFLGLELELAPSDPVLFLFAMLVVFLRVQKICCFLQGYCFWLIGKRFQRCYWIIVSRTYEQILALFAIFVFRFITLE